jgi:PmbA protein
MISEKQKDTARWAMEFALKNGCQACRISLNSGSEVSFEIRDMKIDRLQQASTNSMYISLYADGRYGSFSTNRIDRKELEMFIRNGIDSTKYLTEDLSRKLPDASLYYKGGSPDLELYDATFNTIQADDKVKLAMQVCDEIMGKDSRIVSAESSYSDGENFRYLIASNGFEGESSGSNFSLSGSVSVKGEGDARPSSYWYDSSLYFDLLIKEGIGTRALERTLRRLGQKKIASAQLPMVVDYTVATNLLNPMITAIYGSEIQQKNSFLPDKLDQKVVSEKMNLTDEPHLMKTSGARYFDGEGVATRKMPVFEQGVLKTYYIDTYSADKMNVPQTIGGPSVLTMPAGEKNAEGLIGSLSKGIYVTGFNGGNSNSTTGDFSYGIEGFLIENGKLTQPVCEMNITGNLLTLWSHLTEAGNDPRTSSSWRIPSLLFDGVNFSGL